ncbi:hypothetical protein [Gemmata sp.]|uniref:hypothetical protein n=1 Tax=Gemmata sp. TaxID=1914242 RepID=UPI003F720A32
MTAAFAADWIEAWNRHDLDAILSHRERRRGVHVAVRGAADRRRNGSRQGRTAGLLRRRPAPVPRPALPAAHALAGVNSLVLVYDSVEDLLAAEAFEFNAAGKVGRVNCHYAPAHSASRE